MQQRRPLSGTKRRASLPDHGVVDAVRGEDHPICVIRQARQRGNVQTVVVASHRYRFVVHGRPTATQLRALPAIRWTTNATGDTILDVEIRDQAELQGMLRRLSRAGLQIDAMHPRRP